MEIMEDGNLVDKVRILLQRDMQYYKDMQTVLREPMCVRLCGGKYDFPPHASFAAIKIVTWWEAEFAMVFKRSSGLSPPTKEAAPVLDDDTDPEVDAVVVKTIQPAEIILLIIETSDQFMEHLHTLLQESLDHADLTVLTATQGAAALISNTLWCYYKGTKKEIPEEITEDLLKHHEDFKEMNETIADRLLDLHKRLICLYILMEADSVSWHREDPFFDGKKCSYIYQMWWLYMQGTRTELWNTVAPRMAQRIFAGMLNESLTIMVTRHLEGRPSLGRTRQFWADAFNLLSCTAYLSLSCCISGDEMIDVKDRNDDFSIFAKDIHTKCNILLVSFLLCGAPLEVLFQVFRKGLDELAICKPRTGISPWLYVAAPHLFGASHASFSEWPEELTQHQAVILELNVLRAQPQHNWGQVIKVLDLNDAEVARLLLSSLVRQCVGTTVVEGSEPLKPSPDDERAKRRRQKENKERDKKKNKKKEEENDRSTSEEVAEEPVDETCAGFLCPGEMCRRELDIQPATALYALVCVAATANCEPLNALVPAIQQDPGWSNYLNKYQVWNQARPPWLNALVDLALPDMEPVVFMLLEKIESGGSMYQAMALALDCFKRVFGVMTFGFLRVAVELDNNIPAHCRPTGGSVVLQMLCAALYTALQREAAKPSPDSSAAATPSEQRTTAQHPNAGEHLAFDRRDRAAASLALAEAVCAIDEANKHTADIEELVRTIRDSVVEQAEFGTYAGVNHLQLVCDARADELLWEATGRRAIRIVYHCLVRSSSHLLRILRGELAPESAELSVTRPVLPPPLTHVMFHIGDDLPFDQLLRDYNSLAWSSVLQIPLSVDKQRLIKQVLSRVELGNILKLPSKEREAANFVKQLCTTGGITRR